MQKNKKFTGPLSKHLHGLLNEKRSMGYKYDEQERLLVTLDEMSKKIRLLKWAVERAVSRICGKTAQLAAINTGRPRFPFW